MSPYSFVSPLCHSGNVTRSCWPHSYMLRGLKCFLNRRESMCSNMVMTWLFVSLKVESNALFISFAERMLIDPSLVLVLIASDVMRFVMWFVSDRDASSLTSNGVSLPLSALVSSMMICEICLRMILSGFCLHTVRVSPSRNRLSMSMFDANVSVR